MLGQRFEIVAAVAVFDHKMVYGAVPPEMVAVAVPSQAFKHVSLERVVCTEIVLPELVTVVCAVVVQPAYVGGAAAFPDGCCVPGMRAV